MDNDWKDIPIDAWAIRREEWASDSGERVLGAYHKTAFWVRRGGVVSGIIAACNRVFLPGHVTLVGDKYPSQVKQEGYCADCFLTSEEVDSAYPR